MQINFKVKFFYSSKEGQCLGGRINVIRFTPFKYAGLSLNSCDLKGC